ncbi:hypothetical protein HDU97_008002 [Phlyctochytrium planicorne]|nr:hypothetical protein HDU97_008002 [Phlyctochytrium planicorne]
MGLIDQTTTLVLFFITLAVFFVIGIYAGRRGVKDMDVFLTARGSQHWFGLGLNIFAAGLGVWTILTLPQTGFQLGIQGAFNYAFACVCPILLLIFMGKVLRNRAPDGVTITQFVLERFGWLAQIATNITSLGYMFVYLISELTALGFLLSYFGVDQTIPLIAVCVTTAIYTAIGGMPASLMTDKFQGWFVCSLAILAVIAFSTSVQLDKSSIPDSSVLKTSQVGWESLWTLVAAVTGANVFHQGYWQRVYSAKSQKDLLYACIFASVLTFPFFFIIGFVGIIDVWRNDPAVNALDPYDAAANSFFDVVTTLPNWMSGIVVVLTVALVCSSVDTLQSAISALIVNDIFQQKVSLLWARVFTAVLNIPALIIAYKGLNVFSLFLLADLVASAIVLPVVIGLVKPLDTFFNGIDFVFGTLCGLFSVVIYGWRTSPTQNFNDGWTLLTLPNQIFQPTESVVVFTLAPAFSVIAMVLCALVRRGLVKAFGGNPNARPIRPTLFAGPGAPADNLSQKPALEMVEDEQTGKESGASATRDPIIVVDDDTNGKDNDGGFLTINGESSDAAVASEKDKKDI